MNDLKKTSGTEPTSWKNLSKLTKQIEARRKQIKSNLTQSEIIDSFHGEMALDLPIDVKNRVLMALAGNTVKITEEELKKAKGTNRLSHDQLNVLKFVAEEAAQLETYNLTESDGKLYDKKQPDILRKLSAEKLFYKLNEAGIPVKPEDVLLAPYTSLTLLEQALKTLPGKGDVILSPEGFYKSNAEHVEFVGLHLKTFPTDSKTHKIQPETLRQAIQHAKAEENLKGILITMPGNPFVVDYTQEELNNIAKVITEEKVYVVCDSAFDSITPKSLPLAAGKAPNSIYDRVMTITGNSKSHSAAGPVKFGAACTGNEEWKDALKNSLVTQLQRETTSTAVQMLKYTPHEFIVESSEFMINQQKNAKKMIAASNQNIGSDAIKELGENNYGPFLCISLSDELLKKAGINDSWQLFEMLLAAKSIDSVPLIATGTKEIGVRINIHAPRKGSITVVDNRVIQEQFSRIEELAKEIAQGLTYEKAMNKIRIDKLSSVDAFNQIATNSFKRTLY